MLIGAICLIGAWMISYETGAELLNFGALIGFMGVNAAAFLRYFVRGERTLSHFAVPVLGFVICLAIWLSLRDLAKIAGITWLTAGVLYGAWKTKGFREPIRFETGQ